MSIFWWGAALLVIVALALLVTPLLGLWRWKNVSRDRMNVGLYENRLAELQQERENGELSPEQLEKAREELQRDLLNTTGDGEAVAAPAAGASRWTALAVVIIVPLAAAGLYWKTGTPELIDQRHAPTRASIAGDLDQMVTKLQQRLEREPNDVDGWRLLARSYSFMQRMPEAAQAIGRAVELTAAHPDPDLLAEYADMLASANQGSLDGKPIALVKQALTLNPDSQRALWLAGIDAMNHGDARTAIKHWRHLAKLLPADDEMSGSLHQAIADAEAMAKGKPSGGWMPPP